MLLKVLTEKFNKDENGQSMTQLVIVLPVLIIMLGMIVDVGRVVDTKIMLSNATSESVRYIVEKNTGNLYQTVQNAIDSGHFTDRLDINNLDVQVVSSSISDIKYVYRYGDNKEKDTSYKVRDVKVTLKYKLKLIMPLAQAVLGDSEGNIELTDSYTTRIGVK